jgi:hypothetical protein
MRGPPPRPLRQIWALGLAGALVAQMALPLAHFLGSTRDERVTTAAELPAAALGAEVSRASGPVAPHDPATCPICQSLVRTRSAVPAPTCADLACVALAPAAPLPAADPPAATPYPDHPPRAPPIRSFVLV